VLRFWRRRKPVSLSEHEGLRCPTCGAAVELPRKAYWVAGDYQVSCVNGHPATVTRR